MSAIANPIVGWDSVQHPHIAVLGENPSRRRHALDRVMGHLQDAAADEVRLSSTSTATEIEHALQRALGELTRRHKVLDEAPETTHPVLLIVLEDFDDVDALLQQNRIRGRVHDYLEDLIALGRAVNIHLIIGAEAAQFAFSSPHHEVAHLFVGALDHHSAVMLGKDRTRYPDVDSQHAWLLIPRVDPIIVRLHDDVSN